MSNCSGVGTGKNLQLSSIYRYLGKVRQESWYYHMMEFGQPQTVFGKLTFELNAQHLGAWDLTRAKTTLLLLSTPWGSPADQRQ
jgi:hypothetical protein